MLTFIHLTGIRNRYQLSVLIVYEVAQAISVIFFFNVLAASVISSVVANSV